jgi:hypothetical protein
MAQRPPASVAILVIVLELVAVGVFTLLAGSSKEAGTVVLLFMAGLWMIFLVTESGVISSLNTAFVNLVSNPQNS